MRNCHGSTGILRSEFACRTFCDHLTGGDIVIFQKIVSISIELIDSFTDINTVIICYQMYCKYQYAFISFQISLKGEKVSCYKIIFFIIYHEYRNLSNNCCCTTAKNIKIKIEAKNDASVTFLPSNIILQHVCSPLSLFYLRIADNDERFE